MKKQLVILGIAVLLICVGLSGCIEVENENQSPTANCFIVGEWITRYSTPPQSKYIFYENGVLDITDEFGNTSLIQCNWYIEDEIYLYIYDNDGNIGKYLCELTELPKLNDILYLHLVSTSTGYGSSYSLERINQEGI